MCLVQCRRFEPATGNNFCARARSTTIFFFLFDNRPEGRLITVVEHNLGRAAHSRFRSFLKVSSLFLANSFHPSTLHECSMRVSLHERRCIPDGNCKTGSLPEPNPMRTVLCPRTKSKNPPIDSPPLTKIRATRPAISISNSTGCNNTREAAHSAPDHPDVR